MLLSYDSNIFLLLSATVIRLQNNKIDLV